MDFKMWVLSGHFQGTRNFTFESLEAAKQRRLNWRNKIVLLYQAGSKNSDKLAEESTEKNRFAFDEVIEAVNNNLGSPEAFSIIDTSDLTMADWQKVDDLFGLRLIQDTPDIDKDTYALIAERQVARQNKDYARSDEIRDALKEKGLTVEDTPTGPIWQYLV